LEILNTYKPQGKRNETVQRGYPSYMNGNIIIYWLPMQRMIAFLVLMLKCIRDVVP